MRSGVDLRANAVSLGQRPTGRLSQSEEVTDCRSGRETPVAQPATARRVPRWRGGGFAAAARPWALTREELERVLRRYPGDIES